MVLEDEGAHVAGALGIHDVGQGGGYLFLAFLRDGTRQEVSTAVDRTLTIKQGAQQQE